MNKKYKTELVKFFKEYILFRPASVFLFFSWVYIIEILKIADITTEIRLLATLISFVGLQVSMIWWFRK